MRCLIRYITRTGKGTITQQGKECNSERITLGCAADQDVFLSDLRVALNHARINQTGDGRVVLFSRVLSGVRHNGKIVQYAFLSDGDQINIGSYEIKIIQPAKEYDLVLEVEQQQGDRGADLKESLLARSGIGLEATGIGMRRWSWGLFLTILVIFLALPLLGFYYQPWRDALRDTPLPSDGNWDVGRLASGHHAFGQDCNQCHQKAFVSVRDKACLNCHQYHPDHVDPSVFNVASQARCASCHKDHNGPDGLILSETALCTDCHGRLEQMMAETTLSNVMNFSEQHSQFRATLSVAGADRDSVMRISLDQPLELTEHSNLKFPHDTHLATKGIRSPSGEVLLNCANCHTLEPGGERMAPISFEQHCHDCHKLTFETDDDYPFELPPEQIREVPHGDVNAVLQMLESHYALQALEGGYEDPAAPQVVQRRRRPGERLSREERLAALEWARDKAYRVGIELFEYRSCAMCHSVSRPETWISSWYIEPVRLTEHWFPKARFTHEKHKTMECADCHDAADSQTSEEILMPGIENCRQCHGDPGVKKKWESTCISCHGFHTFEQAETQRVQLSE